MKKKAPSTDALITALSKFAFFKEHGSELVVKLNDSVEGISTADMQLLIQQSKTSLQIGNFKLFYNVWKKPESFPFILANKEWIQIILEESFKMAKQEKPTKGYCLLVRKNSESTEAQSASSIPS